MANEQNWFLRRLSGFIFFRVERRQEAQIRDQELHLDLEAAEALTSVLASPCPGDVLEHGKMAFIHGQKNASVLPQTCLCLRYKRKYIWNILLTSYLWVTLQKSKWERKWVQGSYVEYLCSIHAQGTDPTLLLQLDRVISNN